MALDVIKQQGQKAAVPAKPALDLLRSYLTLIDNSVGSLMFKNQYFFINGESTDVLEDGDLSCAAYVSGILLLSNLIQERHTTVVGTVADMENFGWYKITEPRKGAVILWDFKKLDNGTQGKHRHLGFYLDTENAISNDSETRHIKQHHLTYGHLPSGEPKRDILAYYWHPKLGE